MYTSADAVSPICSEKSALPITGRAGFSYLSDTAMRQSLATGRFRTLFGGFLIPPQAPDILTGMP